MNKVNTKCMMLCERNFYSFTDSECEVDVADLGLMIIFFFCLYWEPMGLPFPLRAV